MYQCFSIEAMRISNNDVLTIFTIYDCLHSGSVLNINGFLLSSHCRTLEKLTAPMKKTELLARNLESDLYTLRKEFWVSGLVLRKAQIVNLTIV